MNKTELNFQVFEDEDGEIVKLRYNGNDYVPKRKKLKEVKLTDETMIELNEMIRSTLINELLHDRVLREKTAERLVGNLQRLDSDSMVKRIASNIQTKLVEDELATWRLNNE